MQDGVIGRLSVAPEKARGVSRISCLRVAGLGQRMEMHPWGQFGYVRRGWACPTGEASPYGTIKWRENPLLIRASEKTIAIPTCLQARSFGVSLLFKARPMTQPVKLFQRDSAQFVLKSPSSTQTQVQEACKLQLVLGAQLLGLCTSARKKGILVETCSVCCSVCKLHVSHGMLHPQRVIRIHGKKNGNVST